MADEPARLSTTAAISMSTAGGGAALLWIVQCLQQHALVTPDSTTAIVLSGAIAPALHSLQKIGSAIVAAWLARKGIVITPDAKQPSEPPPQQPT